MGVLADDRDFNQVAGLCVAQILFVNEQLILLAVGWFDASDISVFGLLVGPIDAQQGAAIAVEYFHHPAARRPFRRRAYAGQDPVANTCRGRLRARMIDDRDDGVLAIGFFVPLDRPRQQAAFAVPGGDVEHGDRGQGSGFGKAFALFLDQAFVLQLTQNGFQIDPLCPLQAKGTRHFALAGLIRVFGDEFQNCVAVGHGSPLALVRVGRCTPRRLGFCHVQGFQMLVLGILARESGSCQYCFHSAASTAFFDAAFLAVVFLAVAFFAVAFFGAAFFLAGAFFFAGFLPVLAARSAIN